MLFFVTSWPRNFSPVALVAIFAYLEATSGELNDVAPDVVY